MDHVIVHYGEIALKGANRTYFEKLLVQHIKAKMGDLLRRISRESGQMSLQLVDEADQEKVKDILSRIPGIHYFSFAKQCGLDLDEMKKAVLDFLKSKSFSTFKIDAKRRNKDNAFTSDQLNNELGALVVDELGKKAKMIDPDVRVKVEVANKYAYVSCEDIAGVGGIPAKKNQRVVALLSGGFDSPVAAYLMMKRGCKVILVHFQNVKQMKDAVKDKVGQIAEQLAKYQVETRFYIVPFADIQKEIVMKVKSETRMLVYRKFMLRIASAIAKEEKADFLVVGDSLAQVASQTLSNLRATYADSPAGILSPLIGMDKVEIMDIARKIGTYDISKLPYGDCCSYFLPKHPTLNTSSINLRIILEHFDVDGLVEKAVKDAEVKEF